MGRKLSMQTGWYHSWAATRQYKHIRTDIIQPTDGSVALHHTHTKDEHMQQEWQAAGPDLPTCRQANCLGYVLDLRLEVKEN